jgi:hypothetical protein
VRRGTHLQDSASLPEEPPTPPLNTDDNANPLAGSDSNPDPGGAPAHTTAVSTTSAAHSNPFPSLAALRPDMNPDHLREATPADLERLLSFARQTSGGCVSTVDICSKLRDPKVVQEVQNHLDSALMLYKERNAWPCVVLLKLKAARFQASATLATACVVTNTVARRAMLHKSVSLSSDDFDVLSHASGANVLQRQWTTAAIVLGVCYSC